LSITEGSELEEKGALDGLCSEKHAGERQGHQKNKRLLKNQALHFDFKKLKPLF